jgi:hypothetical protein
MGAQCGIRTLAETMKHGQDYKAAIKRHYGGERSPPRERRSTR